MSTVHVSKMNSVWARIECTDESALMEMEDHFAFFAPGYRYHPKFKHKMWDGRIRLFSPWKKRLYIGLVPYMERFCGQMDISFSKDSDLYDTRPFTREDAEEYAKSRPLTNSKGEDIFPYDEQIDAFRSCVANGRRTILSPTASGKSLVIYLTSRWFIDNQLEEHEKVLIIVPTTSLVKQMSGDFVDYSIKDPTYSADDCHEIMAGREKHSKAQIFVSTWQSLMKQPKTYFDQFKVVICDEVHGAKATSITRIMESCHDTLGRFGFTGTLDGMKANKLTIEGLFGPVDKITTSKKLMEQGKISKLRINMVQFKYREEECQHCRSLTYQQEVKYVNNHKKRNHILGRLLVSREGNSLTLVQHVKHGESIYNEVKKQQPDREVYFIHGNTSVEERERIRLSLESKMDVVVIATYGVFAAGINAPNIHHVIFGSSSKSQIRVLQSIGRGLRLHYTKNGTVLYDIVDDLKHKRRSNYLLKHAFERANIYKAEEWTFEIKGLQL